MRAGAKAKPQYRELFENASDIVYLHDLHGRFTAANKTAIQSTGYIAQELLGMTVDELVVPEDRALAREMTAKKLSGESDSAYEVAISPNLGGGELSKYTAGW